jgi:hypothetical protein
MYEGRRKSNVRAAAQKQCTRGGTEAVPTDFSQKV